MQFDQLKRREFITLLAVARRRRGRYLVGRQQDRGQEHSS